MYNFWKRWFFLQNVLFHRFSSFNLSRRSDQNPLPNALLVTYLAFNCKMECYLMCLQMMYITLQNVFYVATKMREKNTVRVSNPFLFFQKNRIPNFGNIRMKKNTTRWTKLVSLCSRQNTKSRQVIKRYGVFCILFNGLYFRLANDAGKTGW